MTKENQLISFIDAFGFTKAADEFGVKTIVDVYGVEKTIGELGLHVVVYAYGLEKFISKFGPQHLLDHHTSDELISLFGAEQIVQAMNYEAIMSLQSRVEDHMKNYGIDILLEEYNIGNISKEKLIETLTFLEREFRSDTEYSNWSFGFSLDGNRLLIRTITEKKVFIIGEKITELKQTKPSTVLGNESIKVRFVKQPLIFTGVSRRPVHETLRRESDFSTQVPLPERSRPPIDETAARELIREILKQHSPADSIVITGGYPGGIPKIVAEVAKELGFETAAIVPGIIYSTPFDTVRHLYDSVYTIGEDWGDESCTLVRAEQLGTQKEAIHYSFGGGYFTDIEIIAALNAHQKLLLAVDFGGASEGVANILSKRVRELTVQTMFGKYSIVEVQG